ncbi:MAG TPA: ferredoxin [Thermoleophilia bacterium]|nr:ferredoxin [Thermoleophilia bacterium]
MTSRPGEEIMRPVIDEDLCIGCGSCEEVCPAVFRLEDDGVAHVIAPDDCVTAGCCEDAADECPVDAINLG